MSNICIGINSVARNVTGCFIGVNGVARKVKKAYIGVNGVARLCWTAPEEVAETDATSTEDN